MLLTEKSAEPRMPTEGLNVPWNKSTELPLVETNANVPSDVIFGKTSATPVNGFLNRFSDQQLQMIAQLWQASLLAPGRWRTADSTGRVDEEAAETQDLCVDVDTEQEREANNHLVQSELNRKHCDRPKSQDCSLVVDEQARPPASHSAPAPAYFEDRLRLDHVPPSAEPACQQREQANFSDQALLLMKGEVAEKPPKPQVEVTPTTLSYEHNCRHCEIGFRDKTLYSLHMGLHSVNQPWQCNMCGKHFAGKHDFTAHSLHF